MVISEQIRINYWFAAFLDCSGLEPFAMLLSICGTQSPLSVSIARIMEVIAKNTLGATACVHAHGIGQLRDAWATIPAASHQAVVLFSDCPQADLTKLLIESGAAMVVCIDDFADIVGFQMVQTGKDFVTAVRMTTKTLMPIVDLLQSGNPLTLTAAQYNTPLTKIISELIDFFKIKVRQEQFDAILVRLGHGAVKDNTLGEFIIDEFPEWTSHDVAFSTLPRGDLKLVEDLSQSYRTIAEGRPLGETYWPLTFFQHGDTPDHAITGAVALAGPARTVFRGPYLHLSRGPWTAEVQIEVTDCRSDTIACTDVFSGAILNAVSMRLPRRGTYAFDIPFEIKDPMKPVEIRMHLLKGALEGELLLLGVRIARDLSKIAPPAAEISMTSATG
jgi:hypothetical protein